MFFHSAGLILRETRYKEADRILTILTDKHGKITVTVHGAFGKKNRLAASTQSLTYSDFYFEERNGRLSVKEATVIENFSGLRNDILRYYLAFYFLEVIDAFTFEDVNDPQLLRLILNSLYALSNNLYQADQIKAAFELKLISLTGFEPSLDVCAVCGKPPEEAIFLHDSGAVCCQQCYRRAQWNASAVNADVLDAMRYIIHANLKGFLSFSLKEESLLRLVSICETYFLRHAERKFTTLDLWKTVKKDA